MTVVPLLKHTEAEQSLFAAFDEAGVRTETAKAVMADLKLNGLPTRRVEHWHYTDLRTALKAVPSNMAEAAQPSAPLLDGNAVVELQSIDDAGDESIAPDDTIGRLNRAFAKTGATLSVLAGEKAGVHEIQNVANNGAAHARHTVTIGEEATAIILERQDGANGFATSVTDLEVGDEAEVTYVIMQQKDEASTHLGQINISLGKEANLTLMILNAGGQLVRQEVNIAVAGEGADFQLRGVNLIGDHQHIDVTMDLNHAVPNTTSEEIIRNVVVGKGHGIFQGKIRVAQIAQKTDAQMACNTLLLSDDGNFSTKPELEIFADDVACGHGATFADLEPSYMFYLMSRGIPEKEARALLIKGFVDEIVADIDHEDMETALVSVIDGWLDNHA